MTDIENGQLTRRQEDILSLVIQAYTRNPEPISSKLIADAPDLHVSSATVRNEMSILEELGYIYAPHTSAGRIPTIRGYRYFVKQIMQNNSLTSSEQNRISHTFDRLPPAIDQWMKEAATVLARTSNSASLVTPPITSSAHFKHLELISIQGRLALMVLVLEGGIVHQQMLTLVDPLSQEKLTQTTLFLNQQLANCSVNQLQIKAVRYGALEREIIDIIVDNMEQADKQHIHTLYRDGLSEIINDFTDSEGAQQAVRIFEKKTYLSAIMSDVLNHAKEGEIHVVVAGNDRWEELSSLSMVLSRYGISGEFKGTMGLVGPTNLNYGRAISTVRYVSSIVTERLAELYRDNDKPTLPSEEK